MSKAATSSRHKAAASQSSKRNIRFRCDFPNNSAVTKVLKERPGWIQVKSKDDSWDLYWCDMKQNHLGYLQLSGRPNLPKSKILSPNQKIPHFSNNFELASKNLLARNLKRLRKVLIKDGHLDDAELCSSIPLTFELPSEYLMFIEEYKKNPGATWIVKPASGCQGRGIFLFQKLKDLNFKGLGESHPDSSSGSGTSYVVQRYIESPYLLGGRKFDLRIYALVTSFSPLKIWLARDGFARLTGVKYSLSTLNDKVHLTNVAIQKSKCPQNQIPPTSTSSAVQKNMPIVESDEGNQRSDEGDQRSEAASDCKGVKWDLRRLRQFLSAKHGEENVEIIFQRITRLITVSLRAVQPVMAQDPHCFELYGYDIILDSNLYPWILEVNASPAMVPTDEEDYRLKYDLITDVLNVLDFEGKLTGNERRVGGLDLIWNDGPVLMLRPGADCGAICYKPAKIPTWISKRDCEFALRLNSYLGGFNDRKSQLQNLEECITKWKKIQLE